MGQIKVFEVNMVIRQVFRMILWRGRGVESLNLFKKALLLLYQFKLYIPKEKINYNKDKYKLSI